MITANPLPSGVSDHAPEERYVAGTAPRKRFVLPRTVLSIGDQCLVSGTNFLTMVIVGRACGLYELGVYSLAFTIVVILMAMQESLLIAPYTVIMSRLRGETGRRNYGVATLLQQLLVACAVSAVLLMVSAGAAMLSPPAEYSDLCLMLAIVSPFWLLKEFARRACYVELNMGRPILLDGVAASVQLSLLCAMWARGELSASGALAAAGAGHASAAAIWWIAFRPKFSLRRSMFHRALRLNWAFGSWACVGRATDMLHAYSIHWLLALVSGPAATGAYAAASSLLALSNPVLMGIGNVLAPETASAYAAGGIASLRQVVLRASCQVTLVTATFVVLLGTCAEPLLNLTFGQVREGQAAIVIILALSMLGGMTSFGADNGLRALARPAENFKAGFVGFLVSLLVAAALVGQWEATGAAIGALAGNLTSALVRIVLFLRIVRVRSAITTTVAYGIER